MRGFLIVVAAVVVAIACGVALESSSPSSAATVARLDHVGSAIRVEANGPCPPSLSGYGDVSNPPDGLGQQLLPAKPLFGVICWYGSPSSAGYGLVHTSLVNARTAAALGAAIDRLSTKAPSGVTNCPVAFAEAAVIAFGLAGGRVVDFWYDDSGCQSLDNGYLRSYQQGDPPFSENFIPLVTALFPAVNSRAP